MKRILFLLLMVLPLALLAQKRSENRPPSDEDASLSLLDIWSSSKYVPKGIHGIQMLHDGNYYVQQTYDFKTKASLLLKYGFEDPAPVDTLFNSATLDGLGSPFFLEDYSFSANDNYILLQTNSNPVYRHSKEATYYVYGVHTQELTPVFNSSAVFYATFSPQEDKVAFVYGNNLYIQDLKNDSTWQITTDGEINKIINGKTDWVYEEEFALVKGFAWSPQGDKLAYYRFDESGVKQYQLTKYDSLYPTQYKYKYPKTGEDNSKVSIKVYHLPQNKTVALKLGEEKDQYLPRMKWTNDNNILSVQRLNRLQNNFEILFVNATTADVKQVYQETSKTYVDISDNLYFLKDNEFLLTSEKNGYNQIYLYNKDGNEIRKVTRDNYDVNDIVAVDEENKLIYYTANDPSPLVRKLFSISFGGYDKKMLSADDKGRESAEFSDNNKFYILTSSSVSVPTQVAVYNVSGEKLRVLEDNEALRERVTALGLSQKEFFEIPIGNNEHLNAWMIKPPDFNKKKKYPVLFSIYGGPGHQLVKDEWYSLNDMWHQYLASKGIIVVSVDNRGTGGRGAAFKKQTYKKLGLMESNDQIAAARYMASQGYVDKDRIGIFGWSFGGYMAALNLMRGNDVFDMAVSVAPVTDWRFYDNIYTERYMQRPQDNMEGYDSTSVLAYVPMLRGDLLVIHGLFDDNVHPHNTIALIQEMIRHNKKFDSEFYPDKNHGIYGGNTRFHLFSRITDYILEHL